MSAGRSLCRKLTRFVVFGVLGAPLFLSFRAQCVVLAPPGISTLMKPALWKRMIEDKEIMANASLESISGAAKNNIKRYSFYSSMFVTSGITLARQCLTDYRVYAKLVPYVDQSSYSEKDRILKIEGGIWGFRLKSEILFEEKTDRWIHYQVIQGHFTGLTGDIYFESLAEKGTVIYLKGEQLGENWPPQFVIERGAEIVFSFTAKRMRSYIESKKKVDNEVRHEQNEGIPKPRSHL